MATVTQSESKFFRSPIAVELERRRRGLGMSRSILAQRSGVSLPTVNRILGGSAEHATFASLEAVANALGINFMLKAGIDEQGFAEQQAQTKAEAIARMVQGTSALESQAVASDAVQQMVRQTVHELMAGPRRRLWGSR